MGHVGGSTLLTHPGISHLTKCDGALLANDKRWESERFVKRREALGLLVKRREAL